MRRVISCGGPCVSVGALSGALLSTLLGILLVSQTANAQIREPGNHPKYDVEVEPHLALGLFDPPGVHGGDGLGPGLRLSFPLTDDGFLPKVNDSVAVGVGLDWVFYDGDDRVRASCARFVPAPNDTMVCAELGGGGGASDYIFVPVVMQWNFWLHQKFSVFAEPGLAVYLARDSSDDSDLGASPAFFVGGRFHFVDSLALTLRLGYPSSSLGLSILF